MKIVHIVENLNVGGLERVVIDLAAFQVSQRHTVHILCLYEKGVLAEQAESNGVTISTLNRSKVSLRVFLSSLRHSIAELNPDVVHTHNPLPNYFCVLANPFLRARLISTRHGMGVNLKNKKGKIMYYLSQLFTDHVVTVCEAAKKLFIETNQVIASKTLAIKNGIFLQRFPLRNRESKNALCHTLGIDTRCNPTLAIIVGRLSPVKNHELAFNALSKIKDPNIHIVVAGDGQTREKLDTLINNLQLNARVHMLGNRTDTPQLLAASDVFVLPSKSEGFSIALLEACAAGLPIIATDVGGNREIVENGVNGILVTSEEESELKDALVKMSNTSLRASMGEASLKWVQKECSIEAMYANYMKLYKS